jgi:hypothetical protein
MGDREQDRTYRTTPRASQPASRPGESGSTRRRGAPGDDATRAGRGGGVGREARWPISARSQTPTNDPGSDWLHGFRPRPPWNAGPRCLRGAWLREGKGRLEPGRDGGAGAVDTVSWLVVAPAGVGLLPKFPAPGLVGRDLGFYLVSVSQYSSKRHCRSVHSTARKSHLKLMSSPGARGSRL